MSRTYSQILLHVVFSTKHRHPWITPAVAEGLYPYLDGIIRGEQGKLYDIGGIEDHVHLYLRGRPSGAVSDLMRAVKANSSKWIHETFPAMNEFAWQEGFAAFSVSKSQDRTIKTYIARQREHHQQFDFKAELLKLLKAHEVEFDERYVFD